MLKFKYHYLTNTLFTQKEENSWDQIPEAKQFTGHFQAQSFILEPSTHWISFQLQASKIKVFYKYSEEPHEALNTTDGFWTPEKIIYYRKYLAKQEEIIFTFTPQDQVEKVAGKWVNKRSHHD